MSLRYIMGKSASGKTTLCINEIAAADNMTKRIFYIVPEQFTLESEKNLLSKKKSLVNINVLGFRHFAYYLISKMGTSGRKILDDTGRAMLIKKIILELKGKLDFYKNSADKQGFTDSIDETLTELMQYSITDEGLAELISNLKESNLKEKLKDIRLIFSRYKEYLTESYIASDGLLDILYELIPHSIVKGSEIWIDGFKSFTPQENKVIGQLLKYCSRVNIAMPHNSCQIEYMRINRHDEHYEVKKAITAITTTAKELGINIEDVTYLNGKYKKSNRELEFLKENYFKYKFTPSPDDVSNIAVYKTSNMYDETDYICSQIKSLVQYKGLRYKDIAIIMGDSSYTQPLSLAFKKYEIPNFLDGRKSIASHPVITLITSAIDIIAYGFDSSAVFRFLKTGYTDITFNDIFELENYTLANGINKYKWKKEWEYGFKDDYNKDRPEKEKIEDIKNRLFEILSPLTDSFTQSKKALVKDITKALFTLTDNINVTKKLEKELNKATLQNDSVRAAVDKGIWSIVTETVDKMIDILGNEKVTLREYSKILKTGFNTAAIGIAPPTQDYVIAGNMELTRFPDIKAMFIIGANEGNIPVKLKENGIFTDDEKDIMKEKNIELSPSVMEKMNNGRLGIYINIIKPSDYLIFSYPTGSIKGKDSLIKSNIIGRIETLFPKLEEKTIITEGYNEDKVLTGKEAAFSKLIKAISEDNNTEFINELYKYFSNDEVYGKKLKSIRYGIFSQLPKNYIDEKLIDILWEDVYSKASVSKLEKFIGCPFAFFMQYVLNVNEREVFQLKNTDIGTLAHKIMEVFSKEITSKGIDWNTIDKAYTDKFVEDNIAEFIKDINSDLFEGSRNSMILNNIIKSAKLALMVSVEQIKASRFKPDNFELKFGNKNSEIPPIEIELENNKIMRLKGTVDRVDKMLTDTGKVYVKIVDYKSSSKELDINKICSGLQLQLAMYMNALTRDENTQPGGMFYFNIGEPSVIPEEKVNSNLRGDDYILNRMALSGMYNEEITSELDNAQIDDVKNRKAIKVLRDISFDDSTPLKGELMEKLLEYTKEVVKNAGNEMAKGNIKINPYECGRYDDACKYCSYGFVCDFVNSGRDKRKISADENASWEKILNSEKETE